MKKTLTPKPNNGDIYAVVNYALGTMGMQKSTTFDVDWGSFHKKTTVSPPASGFSIPTGFVVHLGYKGGTFEISVSSNGQILGLSQGGPPSQWSTNGYKQVNM